MKLHLLALLAATALVCGASEPNTLTDAEKAAGWKLLFDGKSLDGWRSLSSDKAPEKGWIVQDGALTITSNAKIGDIVTRDTFKDIEFAFEFKLSKGANSGVKYFVDPKPEASGHGLGCEFQVLDDENHPDAKVREDGSRTVGSLYDIIPAAKDKPVKAIGEWNEARIVIKGAKIEHWLNGAKVVSYDRNADDFKAAFAKSKFAKNAKFATASPFCLLLQDHGNEVAFRSLKVRPIE